MMTNRMVRCIGSLRRAPGGINLLRKSGASGPLPSWIATRCLSVTPVCSASSHSEYPEEASSQEQDHYDIIINGGGIVGFSLLAALQQSHYLSDRRILLLEQGAPPGKTPPQPVENPNPPSHPIDPSIYSNRVSSLTISSKNLLRKLGAWDTEIVQNGIKRIHAMHVWGHNYNEGITFTPVYNIDDRPDENVVCFICENRRIMSAVQNSINSPEKFVKYNTRVSDIHSYGSTIQLVTTPSSANPSEMSPEESATLTKVLTTSLLIGCDGFNSLTRSKSNVQYFNVDLKQRAIVGTLEVADIVDNPEASNDVAYQRFCPQDGSIFAMLPLAPNVSSFVLSTSSDTAAFLMQLDDTNFVNTINDMLTTNSMPSTAPITARVSHLIDKLSAPIADRINLGGDRKPPRPMPPQALSLLPGSRASYPLALGYTFPYMVGAVREGLSERDMDRTANLVIIGDAAHRIHPLAGQGLNLGLGDVQVLARKLNDAVGRGERLFAGMMEDDDECRENLNNCLYQFERERQLKLVPMITAIHGMPYLFSLTPKLGLSLFNSLDVVKEQVVKFANQN